MWIMGFCIPMSVRSVTKKKTPLPAVIWRITWRSLKLFALGFFFGNKGSFRVSFQATPIVSHIEPYACSESFGGNQ